MSFSWFEKKWLFKKSAFYSGSVVVDPFYTCVISFLMFDESIDFFGGDGEIFIRRVFFFSCNQVFHIVQIGLPTLAQNKVFHRFELK